MFPISGEGKWRECFLGEVEDMWLFVLLSIVQHNYTSENICTYNMYMHTINESRQNKITNWHVPPAKTQLSHTSMYQSSGHSVGTQSRPRWLIRLHGYTGRGSNIWKRRTHKAWAEVLAKLLGEGGYTFDVSYFSSQWCHRDIHLWDNEDREIGHHFHLSCQVNTVTIIKQ